MMNSGPIPPTLVDGRGVRNGARQLELSVPPTLGDVRSMRLTSTLAVALGVALGGLVTTLALAPAAAAAPTADEVLTIAHRGARHVAPENTLIALEKAANRGADFVEVDVQRSKDGRLVLMHDVSLRRTTNVEKVFPKRRSYDVVDFKWRDIKRLDAGRWKADKYVGERIPTLKQALRLVQARDLGILIEMKSPHRYPDVEADVADALREVVDFIGPAIGEDQLRVQSFDYGAAQRFKAIEPRVPVALLGTPTLDQLPDLSRWADEISSRHKTVDAGYVAAVHSFGMQSSVWTVDNLDNMNANLDKGVDAVITNRPTMLDRAILARSSDS